MSSFSCPNHMDILCSRSRQVELRKEPCKALLVSFHTYYVIRCGEAKDLRCLDYKDEYAANYKSIASNVYFQQTIKKKSEMASKSPNQCNLVKFQCTSLQPYRGLGLTLTLTSMMNEFIQTSLKPKPTGEVHTLISCLSTQMFKYASRVSTQFFFLTKIRIHS